MPLRECFYLYLHFVLGNTTSQSLASKFVSDKKMFFQEQDFYRLRMSGCCPSECKLAESFSMWD